MSRGNICCIALLLLEPRNPPPPPVDTNFSDGDFIMIRDSPNKNKGNREKWKIRGRNE